MGEIFLSNEYRGGESYKGMSLHSESRCSKHIKTDIYEIIGIRVGSILMDFIYPIINEFKFTTKFK